MSVNRLSDCCSECGCPQDVCCIFALETFLKDLEKKFIVFDNNKNVFHISKNKFEKLKKLHLRNSEVEN